MNTNERIHHAEKRINELQLLIDTWRNNEQTSPQKLCSLSKAAQPTKT